MLRAPGRAVPAAQTLQRPGNRLPSQAAGPRQPHPWSLRPRGSGSAPGRKHLNPSPKSPARGSGRAVECPAGGDPRSAPPPGPALPRPPPPALRAVTRGRAAPGSVRPRRALRGLAEPPGQSGAGLRGPEAAPGEAVEAPRGRQKPGRAAWSPPSEEPGTGGRAFPGNEVRVGLTRLLAGGGSPGNPLNAGLHCPQPSPRAFHMFFFFFFLN